MSLTKVLSCGCKHEYQDKIYGKGMRVYNQTKKNDKRTYRCTVCGNEKNA